MPGLSVSFTLFNVLPFFFSPEVCTSRFWFNYRHVANTLSMYRSVKRLGIPDRWGNLSEYSSLQMCCEVSIGFWSSIKMNFSVQQDESKKEECDCSSVLKNVAIFFKGKSNKL